MYMHNTPDMPAEAFATSDTAPGRPILAKMAVAGFSLVLVGTGATAALAAGEPEQAPPVEHPGETSPDIEWSKMLPVDIDDIASMMGIDNDDWGCPACGMG
jgi:hypothetical protein